MKKITSIIAGCAFLLGTQQIASAASTKWQDLGGGKARLVAVKDPTNSTISGFIEFQLEKGWKTYWRSPGDAGIPPEFNFSGSNFVALKRIHFPRPDVIKIPDTYFMGYKGNVKFVFEADSFADDASISLDLLAGVCEEICIPATAQFTLSPETLSVSDPKALNLLELSKANLPQEPHENFKVNNVKNIAERTLEFSATLLDNSRATLLLEGPNGWFSGPIETNDSSFIVELAEGHDANDGWQKAYRYTLLSESHAIEGFLSEFEFRSK